MNAQQAKQGLTPTFCPIRARIGFILFGENQIEFTLVVKTTARLRHV